MSTELQVRESGELAKREPGLLDIIQQVVSMPATDGLDRVAILERLMALKERSDAQDRKAKFFESLQRVQSKVPRILQNGLMDRGPGKGQIPYAKREDIDKMVRPIYMEEGFSVTWDAPMSEGRIRVIGRFTCHGHTEEREWSCLPDGSGGKQNPQAAGSTLEYGKRYISKMFWDVIEEGVSEPGTSRAETTPITQNQADDIRTRIADLNPDLLPKFCRMFGVDRVENLTTAKLDGALKVIVAEEKKRAAK